MKQLKEALIGKHNINNAARSNKVYCVAVYDDDLDLRHAKEFIRVRTKDWVDVYVGTQDAVIKYANEIDKMEVDIGCIKNPALSIQDVVDYLKHNDWLSDCERMCDRCLTAHIDESLINKKTINNASGYKNIYCIANYGDISLNHIKEFIKVKCKDWVEIYVASEEDFYKNLKAIKDLYADVCKVKDPSMSVNNVLKYLKSHDWYGVADREICERIYIDNIKESLIGKHNINNVDTQNRTIWWIISPSDEEVWELSIELKDNNCSSIPYNTRDGVTCFIVPEHKIKDLNLSKFNELVFSKTKKKMMFSEVVKIVISSDYYANTSWDKHFNDNLEGWWTNESFIGKRNFNNADTQESIKNKSPKGMIFISIGPGTAKSLKDIGVEIFKDKDEAYYVLQDLGDIQKWLGKLPKSIQQTLSDNSFIVDSDEYKTIKSFKKSMLIKPVSMIFNSMHSFRLPGIK